MADRKLYFVWKNMLNRCYVTQHPSYPDYGGRGITVCERWKASFQAFRDDMEPKWHPGLTLDRTDNNGNYEPGNCRWATPAQQMSNRRNNRFLDTPWGRLTMEECAARIGIDPSAMWRRIQRWTGDKLFQPRKESYVRSAKL